MRVIKIFETSFDIVDVVKMYQPLNGIILEELKNMYEKRCYKSSYIIEIKEILHCSEIEISTDHQQCIGLINITFTALVEIYVPGNIIPACVIDVKRPNGDLIAKSEEAAVLIANNNDKIIPIFKSGDKFPIQVIDISYSPGSYKMTVLGKIPDIKPDKLIIYKLGSKLNTAPRLSDKQIQRIEEFLKDLQSFNVWLGSLEAEGKKKYNDYVSVTYPYKTSKIEKIPSDFKQINFTNIDEIKKISNNNNVMYLSYLPEISRSKPVAFEISGVSYDDKKPSAIEEDLMTIVTDWLTIHYNYMHLLKELCDNYPSPLTDKYKIIWGLIHIKKAD